MQLPAKNSPVGQIQASRLPPGRPQCTPLSPPTRWAKTVVDLILTRRYSRGPFYFCVYQKGATHELNPPAKDQHQDV